MTFTRRTFLRGATFGIASISSFCHNIIQVKNPFFKYNAILAESTPRKLALLIGINQYSDTNFLRGCLTDVELQKELLINRFQFQSSDICTLTNEKATRNNIITAFEEHLIKQVQNNDVVVIHFSGYGRQIKLTEEENIITNSLIVYDSLKASQNNQVVDDFLLDTLINLCESLPTNKYTLILDTSYQKADIIIPNKLALRSYYLENQELFTVSNLELNFNQKYSKSLTKSSISKLNYNQLSGLIFSPTSDTLAREIIGNSFNVGLFSYYLTQSLWHIFPQTKNLTILQKINSEIGSYSFNGEKINVIPNHKIDLAPYYLSVEQNTQGDALITKFTYPNNIELKLLGLPLFVLANYQVNSCFTATLNTEEIVAIQINSLNGNKAKGIVINLPNNYPIEGLIVEEYLRIINRNKGLTVALDNSLAKIEKVDATSALNVMDNVESVINIGDNFADCILSKLTNNSQPGDTYGLFSPTGILLPNTTAKTANEAVMTAVKRLSNHLERIISAKLLHLIINENSHSLAVNISLEIKDNNNKNISNYIKNFNSQKNDTEEIINKKIINESFPNLLLNIPQGSQLSLTIKNENEYDLYCVLIIINSDQKISSYFATDASMFDAGETINIPTNSNFLPWLINSEKGIEELIVIFAKSPFNKAINYLYNNANLQPDKEQFLIVDNPHKFISSILDDLHTGTKINNSLIGNLNLNEVYTLDLNNWITYNFIYEVV